MEEERYNEKRKAGHSSKNLLLVAAVVIRKGEEGHCEDTPC
jgi:hypothetical protein